MGVVRALPSHASAVADEHPLRVPRTLSQHLCSHRSTATSRRTLTLCCVVPFSPRVLQVILLPQLSQVIPRFSARLGPHICTHRPPSTPHRLSSTCPCPHLTHVYQHTSALALWSQPLITWLQAQTPQSRLASSHGTLRRKRFHFSASMSEYVRTALNG